jgi:hypothetical protein
MCNKSYSVVFQTGGARGMWRRGPVCETERESLEKVREIECMGYPAYAAESCFWDTIGLPHGPAPRWDYVNLKRI